LEELKVQTDWMEQPENLVRPVTRALVDLQDHQDWQEKMENLELMVQPVKAHLKDPKDQPDQQDYPECQVLRDLPGPQV